MLHKLQSVQNDVFENPILGELKMAKGLGWEGVGRRLDRPE